MRQGLIWGFLKRTLCVLGSVLLCVMLTSGTSQHYTQQPHHKANLSPKRTASASASASCLRAFDDSAPASTTATPALAALSALAKTVAPFASPQLGSPPPSTRIIGSTCSAWPSGRQLAWGTLAAKGKW
jgi:hypothetical protein